MKRYENENSLDSHFHRCGRPKITSPELDQEIFDYANERKFVTATEISREMGINQRTIGRRLRERGLFCRKPALKIQLSRAQREARIAFIEANYNIDWDLVVFSDEKVYKSFSDRKKVLYRPKNHRYHPDYVQPIQRSGRITCGVWGFITAGGFGELCEISPRMDSTEYVSILNEIYLPAMHSMYGVDMRNFLFMQDNAGVHTSRETMGYIQNHQEINILNNWPAKSPDMNPIENVWAKTVYNWNINAAASRENILHAAQIQWNACIGDSDYISNLYASMPRRFNEILENDGHPCSF